MDSELRDQIKRAVKRHALINAVKHESEPNVGAIMGPLMQDHPKFREHGDEIPQIAGPIVSDIAGMSHEERREQLADLDSEALADIEASDEQDEHPLPELPNVDQYDEVRMRCAPNPNGPWHLGHARMPAVIGTYKQRYDGWFCVRFDDTDPETKRPDLDAYDAILDDVSYLGFDPNAVYKASDRLELYYDYARELIEKGGAYTCSCPADEFSQLKNDGKPCPHRDKPVETVEHEFEQMISGEYDSGEMVLRIKTDIKHKNPALRDWVGFRMIDTPHPRDDAAEYRCWPMLDFQSGIDDHEIGITHIIRGIDLQDSAKRQRFVYDYFDWEYPEVVHWGHVQIDGYDVPMSTSSIAEMINNGELDGWDDPRAPTLASLRRRGIKGDAIVDAMVELGTSTSNVDLSMSSVYSANRERIDKEADRYFFVRNPTSIPLTGDTPSTASPPLHPDYPDRGSRSIPITDAVLIEPDDMPEPDTRVWLKGLGCVRYDGDQFVTTGDDISAVREEDVPVIHWVPDDDSINMRCRTPSGDVQGYAEPAVSDLLPDTIIQFERVGFVRIDQQDQDPIAYFAHQ